MTNTMAAMNSKVSTAVARRAASMPTILPFIPGLAYAVPSST
jgi:hypothetical protein